MNEYPAQLRNDLEARLTRFLCEEIGRRLDANPEAIRLLDKFLPEIETKILKRLDDFEAHIKEYCEGIRRDYYDAVTRMEGKYERRFGKLKKELKDVCKSDAA